MHAIGTHMHTHRLLQTVVFIVMYVRVSAMYIRKQCHTHTYGRRIRQQSTRDHNIAYIDIHECIYGIYEC